MPPLAPSTRSGHSHLFRFINWERGFCSALLFATVAILTPLASAQTQSCDYSPDGLTFNHNGTPPYECSSVDNNDTNDCGVEWSYNNLPPGSPPASRCAGGVHPQCNSTYGTILCQSGGDGRCGSIVDVWASLSGDGETLTVTTLGIGGPSCNVPNSVPPGLGPAGTSTNPQAPGGEPISTGNGNYFYQHTDLSIDDHLAGLPLVFQRTYNSLDTFNGTLGHNWIHNFDITVATTYNQSGYPNGAVVKWGDGHGEVFTLSDGSYVPAPGVTNVLTRNPDNYQYTLTRKDGISYFFTWDGLLENIQNPNGSFITPLTDSNNNLTGLYVRNSGAQYLSFSYNQNNLISSVSDQSGRTVSYAYDVSGNLVSETDPAGNVTKYAYDPSQRLTSITLPDKSVLVRNTYDSSSRVISQTNARGYTTTLAYNTPTQGQTTITDPLGNKTIHTYDSLMRITGITDALEHTTSYTYDVNNNVASITDARGNTTNLTYDSFGNVLTYTDPLGNKASFTYNSFSEPLTITTPKGNTTTLTYHGNGNLIAVQDPLGDQSTFSYDSYGDLTSATDARSNTTTLSWHASVPFCLTGITDAVGNQTNLTCDSIGRVTSVTDPNQHTSTIGYDLLSHVVSLADALGNQTQFGYDTVSNLTSVTDANGHTTSYAYNPVGSLTQVTNALGQETKYAYDKNNNRIDFTNANGKPTKYTYDKANRLVEITDPLSFHGSYGLDADGNVTAFTDANGKKNTFTYDADNRLTEASYSDGTNVKYAYDADSNRKSMVDPHGTTAYAYDSLDRVTSTEFPGSVGVHYVYDPVGNRSSLIYPDKSTLGFTYDADNRLSGVTDWKKRNTSYTYDPASNLTGTTFPNAVTTSLTYDAANRLTGITDSANSVAYRVLAYALDNVGNRTAVTDGGTMTNYTYDVVNELLTAQSSTGTSSWTYDAVGNRTQQVTPKGSTEYTYDADNRMLTAGSTTFTYDDNGNRLTEAAPSGTTSYSYDANNRMLSVTAPTATSKFTYDGDGNRVTQNTPSGTYDYVNDTVVGLPVVLNEQGPDGAVDYAYGLGLTESSSSAFNYFYNLDGLGSVTNLTNANGKVIEAYSYDAWGGALTATGSAGTKNKFRFTGQALDPATGLYFLRARYYERVSGRFLTKDQFSGIARFTLTGNRYVYTENNPATFVDRSGNGVEPPVPSSNSPTWIVDPEGYVSIVPADSSMWTPADPQRTQKYICDALNQKYNPGYINRNDHYYDLSWRNAEHFLFNYTGTNETPWSSLWRVPVTIGYSLLKPLGIGGNSPASIDEMMSGLSGIASGLNAANGQPYQCSSNEGTQPTK
jgi:RHS repeat-associated protein